MEVQIPEPLVIEHQDLHADLERATKAGGKTGRAALKVAEVLHSHFAAEEEYALPPLGLLTKLAMGMTTPEMASIVDKTDQLKYELDRMLDEHQAIVVALDELIVAAKRERKLRFVKFANKLKLHAQTEEQVYYPAAILVGEYLKIKLSQHTQTS